MIRWRLIPAISFNAWSYGNVEKRADFYDPKTWGPTNDLSCECKKFVGEKHIGLVCHLCFTTVVPDAAATRRQRLGHIRLYVSCRHPMLAPSELFGHPKYGETPIYVEDFPVAPIGYRINKDGTPNALGLKYEQLLATRDRILASAPARGTDEWYQQELRGAYREPFEEILNDIVGRSRLIEHSENTTPEPGTLLHEFFAAIVRLDPNIDAIARSMGCELHLEGTA